MPSPVAMFESGPFNGPFAVYAGMLDSIAAAPYEGLWIPAKFCKQASVLCAGTFSALDVELFASNASDMPLNQMLVTVGNSVTTGDSVGVKISGQIVPGGSVSPAYVAQAGDSLANVATGLAAAINANSTCAAFAITAAAVGAVVTILWPSQTPVEAAGGFVSPSSPGYGTRLAFASALSGGATETLTFTVGTNGLSIQTISALGITGLSMPIRWLKARLASMTGSSVSLDFAGVG